MPPVKKQGKKVKQLRERKVCMTCGPSTGSKVLTDFYKSYSAIHADGYLPMCKDCLCSMVYDEESDTVDFNKFKKVLMQIDKPYIESVMQASIDEYNRKNVGAMVEPGSRKRIIGLYFKKH